MGGRGLLAIAWAVSAGCLKAPPENVGTGSFDAGDSSPADASACAAVLEDEFSGDELDATTWTATPPDASGSATVSSGRLHLVVDPTKEQRYVDVQTVAARPLAGIDLVAELAVNFEGNADAALFVRSDSQYVAIYADSGLIGAASDATSDFAWLCDPQPCPTEYSTGEHRFWRIVERDGLLHFQASSEPAGWIELAPPYPTPAGDHRVGLWAECGPPNAITVNVAQLDWRDCD